MGKAGSVMERALFVRINGVWRFEGFAKDEHEVGEFVRQVEEDICDSKYMTQKTEIYKIVELNV